MQNNKNLKFVLPSEPRSDQNEKEREEREQEEKHELLKIQHHTDEYGTTWFPDSETMDLIGELQRVLSRSSKRTAASQSSSGSIGLTALYQEGDARRKAVLSRFRALVRLAMLTKSIPNYDQKAIEPDKAGEERSRIPYFNVAYYFRAKKTSQLPYAVKVIMSRSPWLRSDEDRDLVFKHVLSLGCFDKYPPKTLHEMVPYLNYQFVNADRAVIRQGQMPLNFYHVLTGTLNVFREEKDAKTGVMTSRLAGKLMAGDTFGELSLMQNIPRTATAITKFDSELLWIPKSEFDLLLKEKAHFEWWGRARAIENIQEFHVGWNPEDRLECSNSARLVNYRDNKIITGNVSGCPNYLYFIVSGECHTVEVLQLLCQSVSLGRPFTFKMVFDEEPVCPPKCGGTIVRRFVQIQKLNKGQYFGCGEDLRQRYVIARSNVQCIEVPHTFLRRRGYIQWLELLADKIQASIPSHDYVFRKFVEQASWRAYKKQQIAEVVRQFPRKKDCTKTLEVPQSIQKDEKSANWNSVLYIS